MSLWYCLIRANIWNIYELPYTPTGKLGAHSLMEKIIRLDALDITSDEMYEWMYFPFHHLFDSVDFQHISSSQFLLSLRLHIFRFLFLLLLLRFSNERNGREKKKKSTTSFFGDFFFFFASLIEIDTIDAVSVCRSIWMLWGLVCNEKKKKEKERRVRVVKSANVATATAAAVTDEK